MFSRKYECCICKIAHGNYPSFCLPISMSPAILQANGIIEYCILQSWLEEKKMHKEFTKRKRKKTKWRIVIKVAKKSFPNVIISGRQGRFLPMPICQIHEHSQKRAVVSSYFFYKTHDQKSWLNLNRGSEDSSASLIVQKMPLNIFQQSAEVVKEIGAFYEVFRPFKFINLAKTKTIHSEVSGVFAKAGGCFFLTIF